MRPDLASAGHQIVATGACPEGGHRRHALPAPALGEAERADQAEGDVPIGATIEHTLHEVRVIDVGHFRLLMPLLPLNRPRRL